MIPFKPVFFLTDVLLFLLLTFVMLLGFFVFSKKSRLRALWQIRRVPMAMVAAIVLLGYLLVGLADSVHLQRDRPFGKTTRRGETQSIPEGSASEMLSLLDLLANPLRKNVEKSYSAPLAIEAYSKEVFRDEQGQERQIYPRLLYGGRHLNHPGKKWMDILQRAMAGGTRGLFVAILFGGIGIFFIGRFHRTSFLGAMRGILFGQYDTAWKAILLTMAFLIVLLFTLAPLSVRYHLFGTDKVGQDVLYLSLKAIRTGLLIGALTLFLLLPFAVFLGVLAGYFKGNIDEGIQYLYTTLSSVPGVLLISAAVLILQVHMDTHADDFAGVAKRTDTRLFFLCFILGVTGWIGLCRLLRGETFKLSEMEYVQAARALGVGHGSIILRHILPNVTHIVLISAALDFSALVLAEAVLSYVGVGVDPAMISWGNMINSARLAIAREPIVWWELTAAFVMMFGLVLSANLFADAVRDALDPRLRGRPLE